MTGGALTRWNASADMCLCRDIGEGCRGMRREERGLGKRRPAATAPEAMRIRIIRRPSPQPNRVRVARNLKDLALLDRLAQADGGGGRGKGLQEHVSTRAWGDERGGQGTAADTHIADA